MRLLISFLIVGIAPAWSLCQTETIAPEEREALMAFYDATGGPKWIHQDGWLGPPGSECHWYGVRCGKAWEGPKAGNLVVQILELPNNGLVGRIPPNLAALKELKRLVLIGNRIDAPIPDVLFQRIDTGILEIKPLSLVHDVEELSFDFDNPSMLCSGFSASLKPDGSVRLERRLCHESDKRESVATCEYRDGKSADFDMLVRFLIRGGFFSKSKDNNFNGSDLTQLTLTVKHHTEKPITKQWNGFASLSDWSLFVILEGTIERTQWSAPPVKGACSLPLEPARSSRKD